MVRQHGPTACGNSPVLSTPRISALFPSGTGAAPVPPGMSLMEGCSRAGDSKSAPRAALAQGPGLPEPGSEGFRVCTVL